MTTIDETRALSDAERTLTDDKARAERAAGTRRTRRAILNLAIRLVSVAVFLADRIIVMTARPGKVKASIDVPHPHPRSPDFMLTPEFGTIRNELYAILRDEIRATVARMREARDARG